MPVIFTTATNDGAFWPAPYTAKHELGCYLKAFGEDDDGEWDGEDSVFVQFNEEVCGEDGEREPIVKDGGHNCPMKYMEGGKPEMTLLLKAAKLYGHMEGDKESKCYGLIYGKEDVEGSLLQLNQTDVLEFRV
jgi:hypothetical protein